jgi:putative drug exporter of the RND superfamily
VERLARLVMHHRRIVSGIWLALFLGGMFSVSPLTERWTLDFSLPGQPGDQAEQQLIDKYGASTVDTYVAVVTVPEGQTVDSNQPAVARVLATAVAAVPDLQLRVVDYASTGDAGFVTDDGRTTFALIQAPVPVKFGPYIETQLDPALDKAAAAEGFDSGLTSYALLAAGGTEESSVLLEVLLAGACALLILLFVFASFLALLPLLIAGVAILTTFMLVLGLTTFTDVSIVVQFLIALIGLGVAIDYSLLVVSRWREERAHGRSNEEAVVVAMKTAGHAVMASGVTVAISLLALLIVPVPALRSMGLAGMLIPLVSVAVVLTLLPALLSSVGPRIDYPRIRKEGTASRGWSAWARLIVRHRVVAAAAAVVMLALLIIPVFGLKIGPGSSIESLARNGERFDTLQTLSDGGVGTGVITPLAVLVPANDAEAAADAARGVDGVQLAVVGTVSGDSAVVDVLPTDATMDSDAAGVVDDIRAAVEPVVNGEVGITGLGATVEDYFSAVYDNFPYVLALIALITYILLVRTFRSLLLPLKAVLLNLISLAAVFGAIVFFWQQGHGADAIFNVSPTGGINFWLPVVIFAFLFGLSMDYEVFILARMREEYDRTGDTSMAVITGIGRTGRLVTSAALILFFAFSALALSPGTDVKVLGTALGVGILIDATIVRALLVPAMVSLFGRWNWWLPTWAARTLFVEPSPLAPRDGYATSPPVEPDEDPEADPEKVPVYAG